MQRRGASAGRHHALLSWSRKQRTQTGLLLQLLALWPNHRQRKYWGTWPGFRLHSNRTQSQTAGRDQRGVSNVHASPDGAWSGARFAGKFMPLSSVRTSSGSHLCPCHGAQMQRVWRIWLRRCGKKYSYPSNVPRTCHCSWSPVTI